MNDEADIYLGLISFKARPMTNFAFTVLKDGEIDFKEFEKNHGKKVNGFLIEYDNGYKNWVPEYQMGSYTKISELYPEVISKGIIKEFKTIDDLINDGDKFINSIPNVLGINLCSVKGIEYYKLEDGQLLTLSIIFKPAV